VSNEIISDAGQVFILLSRKLTYIYLYFLIMFRRCRRKLTDREKQERHFKKFKKRHMIPGHKFFTSRVDYIRNVSGISGCEVNVISFCYSLSVYM